ncbi:2-oxoacid:acceptor oxidoreductase subunit alpha [Desulfobulbus elongatus]|uniref:2-oxoacid:acceptor oxidoreductase subunit alpha n=1 Tax=Desulfobulbus elongatus TaxID=53332 RepID=UPI000484635C|nr:2-oxoacid:acceptor oxidoreductase subunit alpha [Desulfobulbus elongatus]
MHSSPSSELNVVLGGEAGHGLQTLGLVLARAVVAAGLHVMVVNEFMSRIRGGSNSTTLRISTRPVRAFSDRVDCCLLFDRDALGRLEGRCTDATVRIGDPAVFGGTAGMLPLPLQELSTPAGGALFANSVACGFLVRLFGWEPAPLETALRRTFGKNDSLLDQNLAAARSGWEAGAALHGRFALPVQAAAAGRRLLLDGSQSVALGALAGGCTFISSYPMSPATGVLIHLAKQAEAHGLVVEQAEDEISAINMGLGAWYAGARALVSTSGGGFDLMAEGLSLCGAIESPLVVHLAQRPGPGTGLPTRTEQGDLEIARYSGHGEFPRAILAPGSPEEAFACAAHAFTMADASQSPVIILTDQYLLDSLCDLDPLPLPATPPATHIVATTPDYRRYAPGPDGISPRGIPGYGAGLVCVDSDEHDAEGRITEDFGVRIAMVDKRLAKFRPLREELSLPPRLHGPADYRRLLVGWGSTAPAIIEALAQVPLEQTAFLHCVQLYPLPAALEDYLRRAERVIVIENNATGQFARLLRGETGCDIADQWLKYNGLAFSVEEIAALLREEEQR